jgi:hypothetical protein
MLAGLAACLLCSTALCRVVSPLCNPSCVVSPLDASAPPFACGHTAQAAAGPLAAVLLLLLLLLLHPIKPDNLSVESRVPEAAAAATRRLTVPCADPQHPYRDISCAATRYCYGGGSSSSSSSDT